MPLGSKLTPSRKSQYYIELYKEKFKRHLLLNRLWLKLTPPRGLQFYIELYKDKLKRHFFLEPLIVGEVVNFIFSYLQCKTLLKIWWGQYYSRIIIKKIFLTSVTPLYIPSESRTRPFPPKMHTI